MPASEHSSVIASARVALPFRAIEQFLRTRRAARKLKFGQAMQLGVAQAGGSREPPMQHEMSDGTTIVAHVSPAAQIRPGALPLQVSTT